jgi:hypothetical protein
MDYVLGVVSITGATVQLLVDILYFCGLWTFLLYDVIIPKKIFTLEQFFAAYLTTVFLLIPLGRSNLTRLF